MKANRLLFLVMAICIASGVKAQFYDGPDDIFYYIEEYHEYEESYWTYGVFGNPIRPNYTGHIITEKPERDKAKVLIFNFDGSTAAELTGFNGTESFGEAKSRIRNNPSYYEDKIETTEYKMTYFSSSSSGTIYKYQRNSTSPTYTFEFSKDREILKFFSSEEHAYIWHYKRVPKDFFKVGRSKTPSGRLYE